MANLVRQIFGIIVAFALTSCSNEVIYNNISQIKYGTSFGECIGYCKHEMVLKSGNLTFNFISWSDTLQPIIRTDTLKVVDWDSIKSDFGIKDFFELPETIGCPDCADGGAEWLEIQLLNGDKHKVTFEYYHEPVLLKNKVGEFRVLMSKADLYKVREGGLLKGKISIGPLCPVETFPPQPQCLPTLETFKAWQTAIWNKTKTMKLMHFPTHST